MKLAITAGIALLVITSVHAVDRTPEPSAFEALWADYQTQGHVAVERAILLPADYMKIRGDFLRAAVGWKREWQPIHARFFLDLIHRATAQRWLGLYGGSDAADELIKKGREFVMARPGKPGQDAAMDEFEVLWHRTVLAMLQGNLAAAVADQYLTAIDDRVGVDKPTPTSERLVDTRLALTAALVKEEFVTPDTIARTLRQSSASVFMADAPPAIRARADWTLTQLEIALRVPDTADEASVRKGFLLFRLKRFDEALATLDSRPAPANDPVLAYWRALFRGRVLEELHRTDDALSAFQDASRIYPQAQSPRVAIASLLQQAGRRDEALAQRTAIGALPRDAQDPWWIYWLADRRFVADLLAKIRALRP